MPLLPLLTLFHYNFLRIHPFHDGNGRTARLLTGLLCMRKGYPPMVINANYRDQYIAALTCANKYLNFDPLLELMDIALTDTIKEFIANYPLE